MGAIAALFRPELRALSESEWLLKALGGGALTATGRSVSTTDALKSATVWTAVDYLTSTIGSLPLHVYERLPGGGKRRATTHYLYDLLRYAPNEEMTSQEYWEATTGHVELWGNGYAEIERTGGGRVAALWPLRPDRMRVSRDDRTGRLAYEYTLPKGERVVLAHWQVMHLRGYSLDGITGLSRIAMAREGIGLQLAAEEHGARFFGNDGRPGGYLSHPGKLSADAQKRLKGAFEADHRGLSSAHRMAVLEEGMTWQSVGMPHRDAQWIELRRFQRDEIAAIMRVKPHKIGILDKATFSNIESQAIEAVQDDIRPRCTRIEQRIFQDLFSEAGQRRFFAEFLLDGLMRGNLRERYDAYAVARQNGFLNGNEIRERENLNPIEGPEGDEYWRPANILGEVMPAEPTPMPMPGTMPDDGDG